MIQSIPFTKEMYEIERSMKTIQICTLFSFEEVHPAYWLTNIDLIWDTENRRFVPINILNSGYPYVPLRGNQPGMHAKTGLYHRIIAFAKIANIPCSVVEHIDDDPFNCRTSNLKLSSQFNNVHSAWRNGRIDKAEAEFRVTLPDGSVHEGTMNQLSEKLGIPRMTIYDRFYKGPFDPNKKYAQVKKISILSVEKIKEAPPRAHLSRRFIDYRTGLGNKFILHLDHLDVEIT